MSGPPVLNESFDDTIIIDGLPKVDPAKAPKLLGFVEKKFEPYKPVDLNLPTGPDNNSLGFIIMRMASPEAAKAALAMNGKPMDKIHTFAVFPFGEMDQYENVPEQYTPLDPSAAAVKTAPYLQDYLLDQQAREQILLRFQDDHHSHHTHISYIDAHTDSILVPHFTADEFTSQGKSLTTQQAGFSPKGSYMYTFHQKGIALWGGANYQRLTSINHPNAVELAFSPCERWIVTMSEQPAPSIFCDVAVWDISNAQVVVRYNTILRDQPWPFFQWSFDGNFFGRVANRKIESKDKNGADVVKFDPIGIAIYDMTKREVVGGKPLPAPNLSDFQFSPAGPELAYCIVGKDMVPSRLVIYDVEKKRELRNNPTFGVENWQLAWQETGQHLIVYVERKLDKRTSVNAVDVYFPKKKNCPLVELPLPKQASRIQISPTQNKILITTFHINEKGQSKAEFTALTFTESAISQIWSDIIPAPSQANPKQLNQVFQTRWSPQGEVFFIAAFTTSATVSLYDASKTTHVDLLAADLQLAGANKIEWDCTGRYFALAALQPYPTPGQAPQKKKCRLQIYHFQGGLVCETQFASLFDFQWRPQPIIALTPEQQQQVKAELRSKYWSRFDHIDDKYEKSKFNEVTHRRQQLKAAWKELRTRSIAKYKESHEIRSELYGGYASDDEENDDDYEIIEISRTTKVLKKKGEKDTTAAEAVSTPE